MSPSVEQACCTGQLVAHVSPIATGVAGIEVAMVTECRLLSVIGLATACAGCPPECMCGSSSEPSSEPSVLLTRG